MTFDTLSEAWVMLVRTVMRWVLSTTLGITVGVVLYQWVLPQLINFDHLWGLLHWMLAWFGGGFTFLWLKDHIRWDDSDDG